MKLVFVIIFLVVCFINIGSFLDVTQKPEKSDVIISLGGNTDRSTVGVKLIKKSYAGYNRYYFIGIKKTLISQMKERNINITMISDNITYVHKMKNTMDEIMYIDNNIATKYDKIIIVTDPPHSIFSIYL